MTLVDMGQVELPALGVVLHPAPAQQPASTAGLEDLAGDRSSGRGSEAQSLPAGFDPFCRSKVAPTGVERVVAGMIAQHRGWLDPIKIESIAAAIGRDERAVKGIVAELIVTHRCLIGGRREIPAGYFWIRTAEDLEKACAPFEAQIFWMWKRLRALRSKEQMAKLYGQLTLEEA